jgi:hypothetical protein
MKIVRKSLITGKIRSRDLPVTEAQLTAWRKGTLIQDAMPQLSADEREFIKTGITADEWDEAFTEDNLHD